MGYQVEEEIPPHEKYQQLMSSLPLCEDWHPIRCRNYHGFWYPEISLPGFLAFHEQIKPRDTDIFLCTPLKSGTTWLKALTFATITRKHHKPSSQDHPLLLLNPHDCIPFVDEIYGRGQASKFENLAPPRIFGGHAGYQLLPESLTNSLCKIVYICRDPKDTLVSGWHFLKEMTPDTVEPVPFSKNFDMFCEGVVPFGPLWDHYLGYWSESLKRPSKILFLKYEELMEDPRKHLRKLAEFLGCAFSEEEEREDVVEEIVRLCSFEKLKEAEGNKKGDRGYKEVVVTNSSHFRKGKVGDWKNYLSPEMAERMDDIYAEKLSGSGLSF